MEISSKLKSALNCLDIEEEDLDNIVKLISKDKKATEKQAIKGVIEYLQSLESKVLCSDEDKYIIRKVVLLLNDKFEMNENENC